MSSLFFIPYLTGIPSIKTSIFCLISTGFSGSFGTDGPKTVGPGGAIKVSHSPPPSGGFLVPA